MTYAELVARLTAAVDSTDPVTDGDANESDEQQAEYILARLVASHDHPGGAVTPVSDRSAYAARLARWEDNIDQESARNAQVPVLHHYAAGAVAGYDYPAALAAATTFVEYLDALE